MITRCPSCQTAFKVVPDQLRIAAGWVRCGHCGELFDGQAHLIDRPPARDPSVKNDVPLAFRAEDPAPDTPQSTPESEIEQGFEPSAPAAEVDFQPTVSMEPEEPSIAVRLEAERQEAERQTAAPVPVAALDVFPAFSADPGSPPENRFAVNAPTALRGGPHEPSFRMDDGPTAADSFDWVGASPMTPETPPAPPSREEPALGQDPFASARIPSLEHAARSTSNVIPAFVRQPKVHRFWDSSAVRTLLWIALPLLIAALAAQWVLHERNWLAARVPPLAPALGALCAPLGCAVQPYRMLNAIAIDGSDFKAIDADTFRFDLSVRNSADVAVAMPAFQLTLSDIQGHVLVRRVIQATELDAPATLKAHGEFDATRALHIAGVAHPEAITSYRVVAFYP